MPGQVYEDYLALLGELIQHGVPRLAAVTDTVQQHERLARTDALERQPHARDPTRR
jgi:hypothetical protein